MNRVVQELAQYIVLRNCTSSERESDKGEDAFHGRPRLQARFGFAGLRKRPMCLGEMRGIAAPAALPLKRVQGTRRSAHSGLTVSVAQRPRHPELDSGSGTLLDGC